jgi:hypothetical protein
VSTAGKPSRPKAQPVEPAIAYVEVHDPAGVLVTRLTVVETDTQAAVNERVYEAITTVFFEQRDA